MGQDGTHSVVAVEFIELVKAYTAKLRDTVSQLPTEGVTHGDFAKAIKVVSEALPLVGKLAAVNAPEVKQQITAPEVEDDPLPRRGFQVVA